MGFYLCSTQPAAKSTGAENVCQQLTGLYTIMMMLKVNAHRCAQIDLTKNHHIIQT